MKDWTGNKKSAFTTIGAAGHANHARQSEDYYATEPKATELLCELEQFSHDVWEPACGEGHMVKVLQSKGYNVRASDLIDRGGGYEIYDFLDMGNMEWNGDIITNPPYRYAKEFVEKGMSIIPKGHKVAMFLKLTFLEGKARKEMFRVIPPKIVYVSSSRLKCAINGDFEKPGESATAYAWFLWEKGFKDKTIIKWFN